MGGFILFYFVVSYLMMISKESGYFVLEFVILKVSMFPVEKGVFIIGDCNSDDEELEFLIIVVMEELVVMQ